MFFRDLLNHHVCECVCEDSRTLNLPQNFMQTRKSFQEIVRVFTPYGIDVSRRHLTLTADYMTFTGCIQPFTRGSMNYSASPLQKMTFETTVAFMRDSIIHGKVVFILTCSIGQSVGRTDYCYGKYSLISSRLESY